MRRTRSALPRWQISGSSTRSREQVAHVATRTTSRSQCFQALEEEGSYGQAVAIGRRNWLFADTQAGADASANLYSLLQTCLVNGIDGYRYLKALLVALPKAKTVDDFEALLPWRIALT